MTVTPFRPAFFVGLLFVLLVGSYLWAAQPGDTTVSAQIGETSTVSILRDSSLQNPPVDSQKAGSFKDDVINYSTEITEWVGDQQEHSGSSHGDPFASVFKNLFFLLLAAVLGRYLAKKLHQPAVLGELLIGVFLGAIAYYLHSELVILIRHKDLVAQIIEQSAPNLTWMQRIDRVLSGSSLSVFERSDLRELLISPNFPEYYRILQSTLLFSSLGVILLLFMVGLESSVEEMQHAGKPALIVAILGVVLPFVMGYFASWALLPAKTDPNVLIFIGATLCATSIGITARVFKDMRKLQMPEAKVVLGAAVLDDVLGLIVLAVVSGIITSGHIDFAEMGLILLKSVLFLGFVLLFGARYMARNIRLFAKLDQPNFRLMYPIGLLVVLAWMADAIGLATIVGAFAAGLIIKEEYFAENDKMGGSGYSVEKLVAPIEGVFAPVFFVLMGVQVDIMTFTNFEVVSVALLLTLVAIAGKVIATVFLPKSFDKLVVGIGMIPRGEVGLIFAGIGKSLGVLDAGLFSAVIIIVILTTLITPPLLKWSIDRRDKKLIVKTAH